MKLKDYQKRCLKDIKLYLQSLVEYKDKYDKYIEIDKEMAFDYDFPKKAWEQCEFKNAVGESVVYNSKQNGLNEPLPNFCIKVPTGGGKTFLATRTVDLINTIYRKKKTGIVLWIVPTNQIYRQTINSLKNREHPYRQVLDLSSGGRTLILEKGDRFTTQDINENLVIMMLMLPSANRQNKETLKIFQDAGGFDSFFPPDDDFKAHEDLIDKFPNLDYFGEEDSFWKQIKTSLGNTLRILKPVIIIDEGQKAYSENAQKTIRNFNPSIVVELSATPPSGSNPISHITGQDLNREEMIKLDIHVVNKATTNWKDVVLSSVEKRNSLEKLAKQYESQTGQYIRPICLIQVERTGKNQINSGYIHSEHVKDYLMNECGISSNEIAIKSSEKDDIEGIDLLSKDCSIRYIITKQALQEGWDCSFAYVLTVLTDTSSEMNITQLVGRILRQPYAKKTKIIDLDESYVYCYRPNTNEILNNIKKGLEGEGLGDIAGRVISESGDLDTSARVDTTIIRYREEFKKFEGRIYLPRFIIRENESYRELSYEMDILSRINWNEISLKDIESLVLSPENKNDIVISIALSDSTEDLIEKKISAMRADGLIVDYLFITRHIMNVVPNPWVAYEITEKALKILRGKYSDDLISANMVFIIQELNKTLEEQRDILAQKLFVELIKNKEILFFLQCDSNFALPTKNAVRNNVKKLTRDTGDPIEKSLFEYVPEEELNKLEQSVAVYIDKQQKLLWWYRNLSKQDYYIQGWKKSKIYPDFILSKPNEENDDYSKVLVVETKGLHLKNEDTAYKKSVFDLCNELGKKISWEELGEEFRDKTVEFQIIFDKEWQRKLNEIFDVW
ncbi:DEAD/DEAH box helicase [Acidilutibacter cellobiosedens]|nr:DEAD/DEAH box helicase family protein [Acidilutibacter cellobiosedens]